jgi:hypothetical protein
MTISCTHDSSPDAAARFYVVPVIGQAFAYCDTHAPRYEGSLADHFDYTNVVASSNEAVIDLITANALGQRLGARPEVLGTEREHASTLIATAARTSSAWHGRIPSTSVKEDGDA